MPGRYARGPALALAGAVLGVCFLSAPANAQTITFKQRSSAVPQTPQSSVAVLFAAAQTAGNLNVVAVGWNDPTSQVLSVSDTRGNAYVRVAGPTVQPGIQSHVMYAAANIAAAAANANTVTVTFDTAVSYPDVRIAEYSGIDPANPVVAAVGASGTGNLGNSGTVATTSASTLLVGADYVQKSTTAAGAGYTSRVITSPDGNILEDRVVTAPGTYSATAALKGSGGWVMQVVAFRGAVAGGGDTQPPTAPANLTATAASSSQINLSWTAATDDVGVTGYRVERCQGAGCGSFAQVGTPAGTNFSDTGLQASTSYSYRVRATDAAANLGPYSATATAATPAGAPPPPAITFRQRNYAVPQTPQTTVAVTYTAAQTAGNLNVVVIGWNNATSQVLTVSDTQGNPYLRVAGPTVQPGIQSQVIYAAASIAAAAANANTVTVTFNAAVSYPDVRIAEYSGIDPVSPLDAATGASGTGNLSNSGAVTTTSASALVLGANYVQTVTTGPGAGFTSRVITSPNGSILEDRVVTAAGSYNATAPLSSGGWVMQVVAFRGATAAGGDTQPPTAPTNLTATAGTSNDIALAWTASTDDVGVTGYRVERCQGVGCSAFAQIATPGGTTFNDTGLLGGTTYSYRVRAADTGNLSAYSNVATATTAAGAPPTVTIVTPPAGGTLTGTVTLTAVVTGTGIGGVQFQVDGVNVGPAATAPYSISLATAQFPNGEHAIGAYAWDNLRRLAPAAPVAVTFSNGSPGNPAQTGLWSPVFPWPLVGVHINLLKDGRVLAWDKMDTGNPLPQLWDPVTSAFTSVPTNDGANLFCAGHVTLPDGRLLSAGGHAANHIGLAVTRIYDPETQLWTSASNMAFGRWYPTLTVLPDGRVIVLAGEVNCQYCEADIPEVFNPATGTWSALQTAALSMPWYPHAFVLPDGRLLVSGTTETAVPARVLDLATQAWTVVDPRVLDGYSSAMYLPGKILKSGTACDSDDNRPSAATSYVLDMTAPSPAWRQVASMAFPRAYHVETLLPDGTILVTGGGRTTGDYDIAHAVYAAELWSPTTETWTTMSAAQSPRLYHGSALLLPDARVLVSGGGRSPGPDPRDQENAEVFAPPYLFKGPRPKIDSAPAQIAYGQSFTVQTADAARVAKVVLVGLGAMTHGFNMGQRYLPLAFSTEAGALTVIAPANTSLAPSGPYMLFLVDSAGVPSVASFVTF